jgi:hypothetical protein
LRFSGFIVTFAIEHRLSVLKYGLLKARNNFKQEVSAEAAGATFVGE